jgi:hypothetical protein
MKTEVVESLKKLPTNHQLTAERPIIHTETPYCVGVETYRIEIFNSSFRIVKCSTKSADHSIPIPTSSPHF